MFRLVRKCTVAAYFNAFASDVHKFRISRTVFYMIHRTVTEQTVEILRVAGGVTGEELAFRVLYEGVVALAGLLVKYVIAHC